MKRRNFLQLIGCTALVPYVSTVAPQNKVIRSVGFVTRSTFGAGYFVAKHVNGTFSTTDGVKTTDVFRELNSLFALTSGFVRDRISVKVEPFRNLVRFEIEDHQLSR